MILPESIEKSGVDDSREEWFKSRISRMNASPGNWSLYFKNLQTSYTYGFNENSVMDAMSIIKIPLLLTLLKKADEGLIDLQEEIVISKAMKRFGTGILSSLDEGHKISVRDAAVLMISLSDNTATDILYGIVDGPEQVNLCMAELGLDQIQTLGTTFDWFSSLAASIDPVAATYGPEELFAKGFGITDGSDLHRARSEFHFGHGRAFSLATTGQIGRLIELLSVGSFVNEKVSASALDFLKLQIYGSRIPRYLPPDALVFHKTGDFNPFIANDVGLVQRGDGNKFILCFFSSGNNGVWGESEEIIARIAQECFFSLDKIA